MKKTINETYYNTDTAKELADIGNGLPINDPKHYVCKFYRSKNGDFFLYISFGPDSDFAKTNDGTRWVREIIPLSIREANIWAKNKMEYDAIDEVFGGELIPLQIRLPAEVVLDLKLKAAVQGRLESDLIKSLVVRRYLDAPTL